MAKFLVSYDLRKPGRDYTELFKAIKAKANGWAHPAESVWLIGSDDSAAGVCNALKAHVDPNDGLIVIELGRDWATIGIDSQQTAWMQQHL
jgi:hypothetical protein